MAKSEYDLLEEAAERYAVVELVASGNVVYKLNHARVHEIHWNSIKFATRSDCSGGFLGVYKTLRADGRNDDLGTTLGFLLVGLIVFCNEKVIQAVSDSYKYGYGVPVNDYLAKLTIAIGQYLSDDFDDEANQIIEEEMRMNQGGSLDQLSLKCVAWMQKHREFLDKSAYDVTDGEVGALLKMFEAETHSGYLANHGALSRAWHLEAIEPLHLNMNPDDDEQVAVAGAGNQNSDCCCVIV
ncbi:MAG: hypothetical protein COA94_03590 [Rickettsiales bacterium]|nr:MAG: hypothetical protein COA94_03590 [Rickettsiales bacterium]